MSRWLLFSYLFFVGCGCPPDPPFCTVETALPIAIAYDQAENEGAIQDEIWEGGVWWAAFDDPQLVNLMSEALAQNPRISLLESEIKKAYGNLKIAKSSLYPKLDFLGDLQFTQITRTGEFPTGIPNFFFEFGLWTMQLNLYYDLDIWNKNKDRVEQYLGIERSKILDYEWGSFVLTLSVADTYFKWLTAAKLWRIQKQVVDKQKLLTQIAIKTIEHNLGTATEYLANQVNVEQAEVNLNNIQLEKELYADALRALVGNFCEDLCEVPIHIDDLIPFNLPKCLTLDLVGRRLDIQSQLWTIEAACKGIQIARKDFYPDLDLTAFWGFSTIHFNKLFNLASTNWIINPALHLPIFHGGELYGNLVVNQADYQEAVANYNQMVISATQEILDALATLRISESNYETIEKEIGLIEKDIAIEKQRIEHNLDTIPLLIQKQIGLLNTEAQQVQTEGQILGSILQLIRSTGG